MKNPFVRFSSIPYRQREIPLDRIIQKKQETIDCIMEKYLRIVEQEAKDMVWFVEGSRVMKAYEGAAQSIKDIQYEQEDIEEFCAELDSADKIPYTIVGPAGIYISALINNAREDEIILRVGDYERIFHLLGYNLPEGKTLILKGNVGDFIGAVLLGGRLVVEGSTGNWCGANMLRGKIMVTKNAGQKTGEWMQGGEIHVDGMIQGVGKNRSGGKIFRHGNLVVP